MSFSFFFFFFFFENQSLHNSPGFYLFLGFSWNFFGFSWSVQFCAVLNLVNLIFAIIFSHNSVIRHSTYWCQFFFSEIKFPSAWLLSRLSSCLLFFCFFIQVTVSPKKMHKQSVTFVTSFKAVLMKLSFPVDSMFWSSLCMLKKPPT